MRISKPTILITADIDKLLPDEMITKGFDVDVIPFIQTKTIRTTAVKIQIEDILHLKATVVFTSANGVKAVSEYLQNKKPGWKIYCIGNTTRTLVEKLFGKASIAATADDATTLAEKIVSDKIIHEIFFFCGDKRRDELPDLLQQNDIVVHAIKVYTTTILQHQIEKDYDAVLFFSPSAAQGFFENNKLPGKTILFTIGGTTASEIKKYSTNKIVISDTPAKRNLIEKAIAYFKV